MPGAGRKRAGEDPYRTLFASIDEGLCLVEVLFDDDGVACDYRFLETNPAFERLTGFVGAVGRRMRELEPAREAQRFELFGRIVRTGAAQRFETLSEARGRWFDVHAFRVGAAEERRVAILFRDITAARATEGALRETRTRLDEALAAARMGHWEWDPATGGLVASPSVSAVLGLPPGTELTSREQVLAMVHPADRAEHQAIVETAVARGEEWRSEYRIVRPHDGEVAWLEERAAVAFDHVTRQPRATGLVLDITDRKRADAAAALQRAERERLAVQRRVVAAEEEERRRLARELHDELGQHLAALGLGLQSLSDVAAPGSEVDRRAARMRELVGTMGRELHDLAVRLRPKALDDFGLEAALGSLVAEWSTRTGIVVEMHADLRAEPLPIAVEAAVYRIVQEALTNVARHSGARRAGVVVERRDGDVLAVIEDAGRGFDVEARAGDAADAPRLGLRGIRERAAVLGGTADVESSPGGGTTLFVRIPTGDREHA